MTAPQSLSERIRSVDRVWREYHDRNRENSNFESALPDLMTVIADCYPPSVPVSIRLVYQDQEYATPKFSSAPGNIFSAVHVNQQEMGRLELHFNSKKGAALPALDLADEQLILDLLAERLATLEMLAAKNEEIERLRQEAVTAYDRTIEAWAAAFDTQQKEASGHTGRVTSLALALAREMDFSEEALANVRRGALLHDIGKISIPDEIISKPGKLTEEEYEVVKQSPVFAKKWLSEIEFLKPALEIPYYHHEKWDGTGYPQGLSGEDIPLAARMFAIVDVWDALTSDRPYRQALSQEEALNLIVSQSGSHFDPKVVERFVRVLSEENQNDAPHKLRIRAFGQEKVWVKNIQISSSDWQVHAARELFFMFLAHPEGLTKEQVGLNMWPDATTEELDIRFKNTLYRLRSAVGKHVVLLNDGIYQFNPMLDYTFDVEIFTLGIERAHQTENLGERVKQLSRAVSQYKGDYLPEIDAYWATPDREKFRMMYVDSLIELAAAHYERGVFKSAYRYCRQALDVDPVREEAHRLAMQIQYKLGNRAEIIHQFELCRKELHETYHVSPSQITIDLFHELVD